MGPIYKRTELEGNRGRSGVNALFDTGASRCFVRRDIALQVGDLGHAPRKLRFEMATGSLETDEVILGAVAIDGVSLFWNFVVVPDLLEELILGADFMQVWKIRLDPEREEVILDPSALRLKLV